MTEDYVSFEVAKLFLKYTAFECDYSWVVSVKPENVPTAFIKNRDIYMPNVAEKYPAPTQALACKWLREKYGIHIHAAHNPNKYSAWIRQDNDMENMNIFQTCIGYDFKSHEEAIEAALLYTLQNLIK